VNKNGLEEYRLTNRLNVEGRKKTKMWKIKKSKQAKPVEAWPECFSLISYSIKN
jgi:hypothetical protein